jgi:hypothetical protein
LTDIILDMYINEPVENWGAILDQADFPQIRAGMCAWLTTVMTLFLPEEIVNKIVQMLVSFLPTYDKYFLR